MKLNFIILIKIFHKKTLSKFNLILRSLIILIKNKNSAFE